MNIRQVQELAKKFNSPQSDTDELNKWINELESMGSSAEAHYRGNVDFRYAGKKNDFGYTEIHT